MHGIEPGWLGLCCILLLVVINARPLLAAAREVAPPVAAPYATDRKLLPTESELLDWKDSARNRGIPVKVYFPADGAGPVPVIVFSHGLGGTREGYEYLGRQWAAHGYVSIHLQHAGSDDSVWRGQTQPAESMVRAASLQNALDRDKDVKFAIDQLDSLNKNDAKLKGKLDVKTIGMAGHSFGAETTLLIAGQQIGAGGPIAQRLSANLADNRIKAAIPMSASVPAIRNNLDSVFAQIRVPIFYMTGTLDDSPTGDTKAADRRLDYDHTKASAAAYLLTFTGGDHMVFSGRLQEAAGRKDDLFQKDIRLSSTAFWDAYLKNDMTAKKWLNDGGFKNALGDDGAFEKK